MTQDQRDRIVYLLFKLTFERPRAKMLTDEERDELAAWGKQHPIYQKIIDNWRNGYTPEGQKIWGALEEHGIYMEKMETAADQLLADCKITRPTEKKSPCKHRGRLRPNDPMVSSE